MIKHEQIINQSNYIFNEYLSNSIHFSFVLFENTFVLEIQQFDWLIVFHLKDLLTNSRLTLIKTIKDLEEQIPKFKEIP